MKSFRISGSSPRILQKLAFALLLANAGPFLAVQTEAGSNVRVWDTGAPVVDAAKLERNNGWKTVPSDLLALEADPPKASSDPGYYGREYAFRGDAVIENDRLTAVVGSAKGRVVVYSKARIPAPSNASSATGSFGQKVAELVPFPSNKDTAQITRVDIVRNYGDEAALEIFFAGQGTATSSAVLSLDKTEILAVKPSGGMKGFSIRSELDYGVVPSFIGDDLILGAAEYPSANTLSVPAENLFLGLVKGEESELIVTWPKGKQQVDLQLAQGQTGKRLIESVDIQSDGQSIYLAVLTAPGIWHRESLTASFLEKDVAVQWKRPFAAKWKTQLSEAGVRTSFAFRESKGQVWRGVPGSYGYPVWFSGETANYRLSKKVPPKGESLVYFVEGNNTPASISTPADILKATLGRPVAEEILDFPGRKLRTHHRRCDGAVHRACTCGYTEAIQAIFEAGDETSKTNHIHDALDDMVYFVQRHVERIDEYRRFADETLKFLGAQKTTPELKSFVENLEQIVSQIPQEYNVQKENMKSLPHAQDLFGQTMALTRRKDPNNLKAYMDLLKAWRAMGGAQDYVVAQCHTITRKLFQEAGYGCLNEPKAVSLAQEMRSRCRQILRNPDGYEIWADY